MTNATNGTNHPELGEIQALMCNDVLRDWLRHLEHDADSAREPLVNEDSWHTPEQRC